MIVDAQGFFWISHPAVAAAALVGVTGLLVWCHRLLEADTTPEPVAVHVRGNDAETTPIWRSDAHRQPAA